jgi:bifunctional ADP-heptose synthase (sugar kinase/adenylyltransferase)
MKIAIENPRKRKETKLSMQHKRPIKENTEIAIDTPNMFTWDNILPQLQKAHCEGKTIVVAGGHFVFFHAGHSLLLEQGRQVGIESRQDKNPDAVIVLAIVNSDHQTAAKDSLHALLEPASLRALRAYDNRHSDLVVISEAPEGDVSLITDFEKMAQAGILDDHFILVKGEEYLTTPIPEAEIINQYEGNITLLPRHSSRISSSSISRRLRETVTASISSHIGIRRSGE